MSSINVMCQDKFDHVGCKSFMITLYMKINVFEINKIVDANLISFTSSSLYIYYHCHSLIELCDKIKVKIYSKIYLMQECKESLQVRLPKSNAYIDVI